MGAMNCERNGCGWPLCGNLINGKYICRECLNEFYALNRLEKCKPQEWQEIFLTFLHTQKSFVFDFVKENVDDYLARFERNDL